MEFTFYEHAQKIWKFIEKHIDKDLIICYNIDGEWYWTGITTVILLIEKDKYRVIGFGSTLLI